MSKPFTEVPLPKEKPLCTDFATATAAGLRLRRLPKPLRRDTQPRTTRRAIGSFTGEDQSGGRIAIYVPCRVLPHRNRGR